eukprot:TRINITY_DN862_c0_g1_i1.p1 TRINITY_DN862_c0_g1~~TRINITY_DN862_c0_g1_i1.p1  ORF type:complete len:374 (-),score=57.45 TRINITY_DN862_c0_g1_i1:88-1209(-)
MAAPVIVDALHSVRKDDFTEHEVFLASRNHGGLLEGMLQNITPTDMHYKLIHFDVPQNVNVKEHRVDFRGLIQRHASYSVEDLRSNFQEVTIPVTLECAGNGRTKMKTRYRQMPWGYNAVGTANWTGVYLRDVLEKVGVAEGAVEVVFAGLDKGYQKGAFHTYERSLPISLATAGDVLLAFEMNGAPLPASHGFPIRLVVPGWYGMASVKWLTSVTVVSEAFNGFQQKAYRLVSSDGDDAPTPVGPIRVRALMVPPGASCFSTGNRYVEANTRVSIHGRAWAGDCAVATVEISVDGGETYSSAVLGERVGKYAWTKWSYEWEVGGDQGERTLCCRAEDEAGNRQDVGGEYNAYGLSFTAPQTVTVTVVRGSGE